MPHWTHRIGACVLLGTVTTAVVSWLVAAWVSFERPHSQTFQAIRLPDDRVVNLLHIEYRAAAMLVVRCHHDHSYPRQVGKPEGALIDAIYAINSDLELLPVVDRVGAARWPRWSGAARWARSALNEPRADKTPEAFYRVEQGYGWPFPAMRCAFEPTSAFSGWQQVHSAAGVEIGKHTVVNPGFLPAMRVLPLIPAPLPFAADTIIYGALWWILSLGLSEGRRSLRRRRGRCPVCGYDLRGGGGAGSTTSPVGCPECGWNRTDGEK